MNVVKKPEAEDRDTSGSAKVVKEAVKVVAEAEEKGKGKVPTTPEEIVKKVGLKDGEVQVTKDLKIKIEEALDEDDKSKKPAHTGAPRKYDGLVTTSPEKLEEVNKAAAGYMKKVAEMKGDSGKSDEKPDEKLATVCKMQADSVKAINEASENFKKAVEALNKNTAARAINDFKDEQQATIKVKQEPASAPASPPKTAAPAPAPVAAPAPAPVAAPAPAPVAAPAPAPVVAPKVPAAPTPAPAPVATPAPAPVAAAPAAPAK